MSDSKEDRLYYYCLAFKGNVKDGRAATASSYVGYEMKPRFTLKELERRKISSGLTSGAALISITFLGFMTASEFES